MRYSVDPSVFALHPHLTFGVLVAKNITNTPTTPQDEATLRAAEARMREKYSPEQTRELFNVAAYRAVMSSAGINPNKFPPSVEAMFKRVLKDTSLPTINALVDLCNAVSIEHVISLGGHDLRDIHDDLSVRFSQAGDVFLPFGASETEEVEAGELVFTSGNAVQTRKWVWRQSKLGKILPESSDVFFQLVGFADDSENSLAKAMDEIAHLIEHRFGGTYSAYVVNAANPSIEF